jgi:hypothetical protein
MRENVLPVTVRPTTSTDGPFLSFRRSRFPIGFAPR